MSNLQLEHHTATTKLNCSSCKINKIIQFQNAYKYLNITLEQSEAVVPDLNHCTSWKQLIDRETNKIVDVCQLLGRLILRKKSVWDGHRDHDFLTYQQSSTKSLKQTWCFASSFLGKSTETYKFRNEKKIKNTALIKYT